MNDIKIQLNNNQSNIISKSKIEQLFSEWLKKSSTTDLVYKI